MKEWSRFCAYVNAERPDGNHTNRASWIFGNALVMNERRRPGCSNFIPFSMSASMYACCRTCIDLPSIVESLRVGVGSVDPFGIERTVVVARILCIKARRSGRSVASDAARMPQPASIIAQRTARDKVSAPDTKMRRRMDAMPPRVPKARMMYALIWA